MLATEEQKLVIIVKEMNKEKKSKTEDPNIQFFTSLIPYIKELSSLERLKVRQQIQQVLLQAHKCNLQVVFVQMGGLGNSCPTE